MARVVAAVLASATIVRAKLAVVGAGGSAVTQVLDLTTHFRAAMPSAVSLLKAFKVVTAQLGKQTIDRAYYLSSSRSLRVSSF